MNIVGLDISFTNTGFVHCTWGAVGGISLISCAVVETKKNATQEVVTNTVDILRRAEKIHREVQKLVADANPDLFMVESMSWPRNASSAIKMAAAWGALSPILGTVPMIGVAPMALKLAACRDKSGSKEDVQRGILAQISSPDLVREVVETHVPRRALREHCWDALGAVLAGLRTEKFGLLRSGWIQAQASLAR